MKSKALPQSLKIGIVVILCLTVIVFSFLGSSIHTMSESTIEEIGTAYMAGMNEQVSLHFETIIELRLTMAESIAGIAAGDGASGYGTREDIEYGARARHFLCAALYGPDGGSEMIFGDPVELNHPEPFLESLRNGERKAASATGSDGGGVILFGVPCEYPMSSGGGSLALVVGLSTKYMGEVLFLDSDQSLSYSFVIRKDGSYVVGNEGDAHENYFDRLTNIFAGQDMEADACIEQLQAAMNAGEDYSTIVKNGGSRRHIYCTNLPYCEWYLVTVLPFERLDNAISGMGSRWLIIVYAASFAVIAMLLYIFFRYLKLFRNQVSELTRINAEMDAARKAAEQARKEAEQANAAKQEFLSSMSHDIRTPMNAIIGMTSLALDNTDDPKRVRDYLGKIALSSKHLLGLINDVLDISKIESGKMTLNVEPVSLREAMDSIVNIMQPQVTAKNQQFKVAAREILSENVCCDGVRLNQVLINLLGNAVKFTPEKGAVQLTVYQEALPEDASRVRTHFLVSDTGIGMSKEYQKVIFESFSREDNTRVRKTEGSGLGMAITKCIVDAMGGTISVRSEQGRGSEFHVVLDLEKAAAPAASEAADGAAERVNDVVLKGRRILLAEDNELNWEVARELLSILELELDWAENGEICVEKFRNSPAGHYDAIIMDVRMPVMDGYEATAAIRRLEREDADIPIIAMTADAFSEDIQRCLERGMNDHLAKPIDIQAVTFKLKKYLK
ncbi:ATP-binding protein [uncultured Oscillibacter sp.]|uniref:ATP-binding protein n=2 Tax=Oscillibacter TaxID=459786 RepID=UPI0026195A63|nr:ATP-binding protein [uncultured Oscillibacter sp.]